MARMLLFGVALALASAAQAQTPAPPKPLIPFDTGDRLGPARQLAAVIVAQDGSPPRLAVQIGAFRGELLEAFLVRFPAMRGQWTEQLAKNIPPAQERLGRFGRRVDYVVGCPRRNISLGCVPAGADVLLSEWLSIHQNLKGSQDYYREAHRLLPSGGWLVLLEHVGMGEGPWSARLTGARAEAAKAGLAAAREGPPVHHLQFVTPTLDDQLAALRSAGFDDPQIVWRRFDTVLMMARKK